MSSEQIRWLLKVLQPERSLASFPGAAGLSQEIHAALLGLPLQTYSGELFRLRAEAKQAASELLDEPGVASMLDHLPLRRASKIVAFGDSLTSEPQSWAVILSELLAARRATDEVSLTISAVGGETTTHALVRMGQVVAQQPDWILFFVGTNDCRTQGPQATKTLVHHEESARNLAELRRRASQETKARCLWLTPPAVNEALIAEHPGLARFGVRFRNADLERVAKIVREIDEQALDLFATLGAPPPPDLLLADGLHFSIAGQKRLVREVLSHWSSRP